MRTLTAEEVAQVRAALAAGSSYADYAAVLTEADGTGWTAGTLRYAVHHPAPVRVVGSDTEETTP